jgi:hypothetical protein
MRALELSDLAQWTPIRLILQPPDPAIDWCDLRGIRYAEPFFDQTVLRWTQGPEARPVLRTGLQELAALDGEPSLDPTGFIFHLSRCGSTLASRLLSTMPGMIVSAEPGPINALLELDPALVDEAARAGVLRLLIRALGRIRAGDETRHIVKLSSWNVRQLPLFRQAFPAVPWVWVHRAPAEILASILAGPPGWMLLQRFPQRAAALFGFDPAETATPAEFAARVLASMIEAWLAHADPSALTVEYRDLPDAVWQRVAPHFGLEVEDGDIRRMEEEARYSAKDPGQRVFDKAAGRVLPEELRDLARRIVDPIYARLT